MALATLAGLLVLSGLALGVRCWFVARSGGLAATTGFEEFSLYAIWKVRHGHTLYEWPQRDHLALTHYNWLFYEIYGWWAKAWRAEGEGMVPCVRLLTLLFALGGTAVTARVIRDASPAEAPRRDFWAWGLAAVAWLGTGFTGWFVLTARPDVAGVAGAMVGLALYLRGVDSGRGRWLAAAAVAFFAAWSCKQTIAWTFAGVVLDAVVARRGWRVMALLTAPFVSLVAVTLGLGGAAYRFSVFGVPTLYHWFPAHGLKLLVSGMVANLFFWSVGAWALWQAWRGRGRRVGRSEEKRERTLALVALPPLAVGLGQICLEASALNNLFEGFVMLAIVAAVAWLRWLAATPGSRWVAVGALVLATMAVLPAVQLGLAARGLSFAALGRFSLGNLFKLNTEQLARRRAFFEETRTLPKPFWARDPMLALPWFSNDDRFPAYLIDQEFVRRAWAAKVLERRFVDVVRERRFAALVVPEHDSIAMLARHLGYRPLRDGGEEKLPTAFGLEYPRPVILVRDGP